MVTNLFAYITAGAMAMSALSGCVNESAQTSAVSTIDAASAAGIQAYAQFTAEYSDRDSDSSYDEASAVKINLTGGGAQVEGTGAVVDGTSVTITTGGTYVVSGTLTGGSIIIEAPETDKVQLVLKNADISSTDGPAICEKQCDKLFITLVGDNKLADTEQYTLAEGEDEPNAVLFTKHDMSINGNGSLTINGVYKHGINTKDDLKITGGTITVTSAEDGIRGRDSVFVKDGTVSITAGGDGIQSNNDSAEDKGRISVDGGTISIAAEFDGIQAESVLQVNGGTIDIKCGNEDAAEVKSGQMDGMPGGGRGGMGSGMPGGGMRPENMTGGTQTTDTQTPTEGMPQRGRGGRGGMPGGGMQQPPEGMSGERPTPPEGMPEIDDGAAQDDRRPTTEQRMRPDGMNMPQGSDVQINNETSEETEVSDSKKGLKSANSIHINGGTVTVSAEDDAVHADVNVTVNDGTLKLSTADDGVHAEYGCTINGGSVNITKSYEGIEGKAVIINGGDIDVAASDDAINAADPLTSGMARPGRGSSDICIEITGGDINLVSGFDGLDSNGNIFIRGGNVTVDSPSNGMDCAIDCDGTAYVYGGTVAASGAGNGSPRFSSESEQPSIMVSFTNRINAGTKVTLCDSKGNELARVTPTQTSGGVIFSSPELKNGKKYTVKAGDTEVEVEMTSTSVSISDTGETIDSGNGMGGGMPGGGRGQRGQKQ